MTAAKTVVAVIGASSNRDKYGNKAVRAYASRGYHVVPVNLHEREIEGWPAYKSILDFVGAIDVATFYVPPHVGERVIEDVAQKGVGEVWLNPGSEGPGVLRRAEALGLRTVQACSILGIGESPSRY
ncbi:MAG: CoA binding domain protein [Acidobacteria bacterium]|nr:CoA binding domain protein [Acidobacteriota bacterium]